MCICMCVLYTDRGVYSGLIPLLIYKINPFTTGLYHTWKCNFTGHVT